MDFVPALTTITSAELRERWSEQSRQSGWIFGSDWYDPSIDALCEACVRQENLWATAERLGAARAAIGASLGETLADVDALNAVMPGLPVEVVNRAVSLGWADRMTSPQVSVLDPLTGLVRLDYLLTRMEEVYRASDVAGQKASGSHALVVVKVDLTGRSGWDRITPLILSGDSMRSVFDGGQTLARLADHLAVVLTERDEMIARRVQLLAAMVSERLGSAMKDSSPGARVWIERLPDSLSAATDLIGVLGR